jgi:hypothetical protein
LQSDSIEPPDRLALLIRGGRAKRLSIVGLDRKTHKNASAYPTGFSALCQAPKGRMVWAPGRNPAWVVVFSPPMDWKNKLYLGDNLSILRRVLGRCPDDAAAQREALAAGGLDRP